MTRPCDQKVTSSLRSNSRMTLESDFTTVSNCPPGRRSARGLRVMNCRLILIVLTMRAVDVSSQEVANVTRTPDSATSVISPAVVSPLASVMREEASVTITPTSSSSGTASTSPVTATLSVSVLNSLVTPAATSSSSLASPSARAETAVSNATHAVSFVAETNATTASSTTTSPVADVTTVRPKDCDQQLMQVDGCIKRIVLIGDREAVIPKTVRELEDNHCNRIKGELLCVREYGRVCLKLFPRTIFTIVRKNVEKVFKSFCATADGKATAVRHLQCFKPANLAVLHSVVDKITHTLEYIQHNTTDVQIIPYMCCAFYTFYRQTQMIVDNMCLNTTGPGTSEFIIGIIKAVVTDALDLGCGQFGSFKKCSDNLPDGVRVFGQIFQHDAYSNSTYPVPAYSPVIPMIAISKRLDSGF